MCGDFNLPHVKWPEAVPTKKTSKEVKTMLDDLEEILTSEYFLQQGISEPTHKDGNTLDLCFTNNSRLIHSYQCDRTVMSHHCVVHCKTSLKANSPDGETFRHPNEDDGPGSIFDSLNFLSDDADWEGLEKNLEQTDWNAVMGDPEQADPAEMLENFISKCAEGSKNFIPKELLLTLTERKHIIFQDTGVY